MVQGQIKRTFEDESLVISRVQAQDTLKYVIITDIFVSLR